jgi:glycosyltransferase involved in cell wall biosynthesis
MSAFVVITGEYPPDHGGVADYAYALARGLRGRGHEVVVAAPQRGSCEPSRDGASDPHVIHLPGGFGPRGLATLGVWLSTQRDRPTLLVQYVPHAFGMRGANVFLPAWLARRAEPVWVMLHEIAFPLHPGQRSAEMALGVLHRMMATVITARADRLFTSTPAWRSVLPLAKLQAAEWSPVFSNLPTEADATDVARWRDRLGGSDAFRVGHFGTYGASITRLLDPVVEPLLLADTRRRLVLLGRGAERYGAILRARRPTLAGRIDVVGGLAPAGLAAALSACDAVLQPYVDGINARRGSAIAALGLGVPLVTALGVHSEAIWSDEPGLVVVPWDAAAIDGALIRLAEDPPGRARVSEAARSLYARHFALARTLDRLEVRT